MAGVLRRGAGGRSAQGPRSGTWNPCAQSAPCATAAGGAPRQWRAESAAYAPPPKAAGARRAPVGRVSATRRAQPRGNHLSAQRSAAGQLHPQARLHALAGASGGQRQRCSPPETAPRHAAVGYLLLDIRHSIPSKNAKKHERGRIVSTHGSDLLQPKDKDKSPNRGRHGRRYI